MSVGHRKAILVSVVLCLAIGGAYIHFYSFFDKNSMVPESHQILGQLEKAGPLDFTLRDIEGSSVRFSDFKNHVVILNFWASWCGPCVEEFPALLELTAKVPDLHLLAVSSDHDLESLRVFLKAFPGQTPNVHILLDPEQTIARQYGSQVLPESYVFAADGRLLRKVAGAERWSHPEAIQFFKELVKAH